MLENSEETPKKPSGNSDTILTGRGISYAQIPRNLFKLAEHEALTIGDVFLALKMFDWCHQKSYFPKFEISHTELAKATKLSRRQVMYGVERLIDSRVILVRQEAGHKNEYQWNEYFLQTGILTSEISAHVPVQDVHTPCANSAQEDVQNMHHIYIEFILDFISRNYLEYFSSQKCLVKRIPPKRGQKGVAKDIATHLYVTRKDSWKDAIEHSYKKCGSWVRVYVALAGGFHIESVNYPRAYLTKLIWDESHQWESKKKSYLAKNGHLDSDGAFLRWILERNKRNEIQDNVPSEIEGDVEITFMTGEEPGGEEYAAPQC